jgi:hypothetical protein
MTKIRCRRRCIIAGANAQKPAATADPLLPLPKNLSPPQNRCRCPLKTRHRRRTTAAAAGPTTEAAHFFCASGSSGYNDHDNLDHGYIMTGYLDIDKTSRIHL